MIKPRSGQTLTMMLQTVLSLACAAAARGSSVLPTKEDFLVTGLEEVEPSFGRFEGNMYAGRLPLQNGDRSGMMMFWLFAPSRPASTDSIQLWLNGGPGCTSFSAGLLMEHSPVTIPPRPAGYCCMKPDEPLQYNNFAWTNATTMLYIEQPVGVGFSEGGPEPQDEDDVAGDVYSFLVHFYRVFPEYEPYCFFVFGESYAGMYAPSIARRVWLETRQYRAGRTRDRANVTVAGLGLGNGWVDARVQGPATIDYAYWHGLIDGATRDALWARWGHCFGASQKKASGPEPAPFHEFNVPDDCGMSEGALAAAGAGIWPLLQKGPNQYDVTTWDGYRTILGGNTTIDNFFNDPRVKKILHAPEDVLWMGCIPGAGRRRRRRLVASLLEQDRPVSTLPYIAELLDGGVRVIIYNGDRDLSTCAQGSEMLLDGMEWKGREGWRSARRGLWVVDDDRQVAGYSKEHRGLSFVVVYNSGHLVPFNQPLAALDLVTRFTQGKSFRDYELPSFEFAGQEKYLEAARANMGTAATTTAAASSHGGGWHTSVVLLVVVAAFACGYCLSSFSRRRRSGYAAITSPGQEMQRSRNGA